jgi:hypothetical protein
LEQELEVRQKKLVACEAITIPFLGDFEASREQKIQRLVLEFIT